MTLINEMTELLENGYGKQTLIEEGFRVAYG